MQGRQGHEGGLGLNQWEQVALERVLLYIEERSKRFLRKVDNYIPN
jgi:hypothetical protein